MKKVHNLTVQLLRPAAASRKGISNKATATKAVAKRSQPATSARRKKNPAASVGLTGRPLIPDEIRKQVIARDRGLCQICGSKTVPVKLGDPNPRGRHLDHVVPWSRGGKHKASNLQVLCAGCNRRKGARPGKLRAVPVGMKPCLMCGVDVMTDRLAEHLEKAHGISGARKRPRRAEGAQTTHHQRSTSS